MIGILLMSPEWIQESTGGMRAWSAVGISSLIQRPSVLKPGGGADEHLIIRARLFRVREAIATVCNYGAPLDLFASNRLALPGVTTISILGKKKSQLVVVDGKRTYIRNEFDIGPATATLPRR
jgi:hypothetical protein